MKISMKKKLIISITVVLSFTLLWGGIWRMLLRTQKVQGIKTDLSTSEVISLTNLERSKAGKKTLTPNNLLEAAALSKAQDMINRDYFDHIDPDGKGSWELIERNGYHYKRAGENLARNFSSSTEIMDAWMRSTSHRANLLSSDYTEVGVAIIENGDQVYIVQILASPLSSQDLSILADGQNFTYSSPLSGFTLFARLYNSHALASGLIAILTITSFGMIYRLYKYTFLQKRPGWEHWKKA